MKQKALILRRQGILFLPPAVDEKLITMEMKPEAVAALAALLLEATGHRSEGRGDNDEQQDNS